MKRLMIIFFSLSIFLLSGCVAETGNVEIDRQLDSDIKREREETREINSSSTSLDELEETSTSTSFDYFPIRQAGETCGEEIGTCAVGLKCAYPCGIQGCANVCMGEDELPRP